LTPSGIFSTSPEASSARSRRRPGAAWFAPSLGSSSPSSGAYIRFHFRST
jgi:hypothetical protein